MSSRPFLLPSKTVRRRDSLLNTWPLNQRFCLCRMVFIKLLFSFTMSKTFWLIGVQSNWFSLTFYRSTFQTIPVFECPPSSTSMFLRHTISCSKSVFTILFFKSNFIFPLSNSPRLLNASLPMAIPRFTSSWHLQSSVLTLPKYTNCRTCSTLWLWQ